MLIELKNKGGEKLPTGGKICEEDIIVVPKLQNKTITANGTHKADNGYTGLNEVTVNVESGTTIPDGYIKPSGAKDITTNGTHDVETYKNVNVNVPNVIPDGYIKPSGTKPITTNGTHDVKSFESVEVNVPTSGSSGGECTGTHVIKVDELPAVGVEGAYYSIKTLVEVYIVKSGVATGFVQLYRDAYSATLATFIATQATLNNYLTPADGVAGNVIYVTDIPDVYLGGNGVATPFAQVAGGGTLKSEITDISQATEDGYYAYVKDAVYCYLNGKYEEFVVKHDSLITKGDLKYISNGDGTCYVSGLGDYHDEDIVIPSTSPSGDTVTKIADYVFQERTFKNITIPDTVTEIGKEAFYGCTALESVVIPNSVTRILSWCFQDCKSLESITVPNGITTSPVDAVARCTNLKNVTFTDGFARIFGGMFEGCYSLESITIPQSVISINYDAFADCVRLSNITFSGTVEQWNAITKGSNWNANVPATKVTCSDGEVTL